MTNTKLTGSEKQVKWAEKLVSETTAAVADYFEMVDARNARAAAKGRREWMGADERAQMVDAMNAVLNCDDAATWIDYRRNEGRGVMVGDMLQAVGWRKEVGMSGGEFRNLKNHLNASVK